MRTETAPQQTPTRLADYQPPAWWVESVHLTFDLAPSATLVRARIVFTRNTEREAAPLELHGRKLTLRGVTIDGNPVEPQMTAEGLTVALPLPDRFEWVCETEIDPSTNTELEGLYLSKGMYCTQCEAEGFRKITFYPDRPDVMAPFTVRIEAPAGTRVLLSNGNPGDLGQLPGGRHFAEWHDPHPKPAYLFALVAGHLVSHDAGFTTASGRKVDLKVWVRPGDESRCAYAMDSLIRSMRWDETAYGREYDLDIFQIVAVDDFNMGAMENKGLNIFNSKYVLASPETATDRDYELIESIVAHEYFHNWTGNRITCRDWFQLCLKEGLTVFRDQCFSADERSEAVQRIQDVKALRARQFREDQGPLAHPVRPTEYIEINNFYTATVYEKGAEVIRMLRTLVGPEGYRKALDLYFERHDGEACTIEQFRACFEDACGIDLSDFSNWWHQAGTPILSIEESFEYGVYEIGLAQKTPPTPGQTEKKPQVLPLAIGLIDADGAEIAPTEVVVFDKERQRLRYTPGGNATWQAAEDAPMPAPLAAKPVLSILRGFSAPVVLDHQRATGDFPHLIGHDTDPFTRADASRLYARRIVFGIIEGQEIPSDWTDALGKVVSDTSLDPAFRAQMLDTPGDDEMAGAFSTRNEPADPDAIHEALEKMTTHLGTALAEPLWAAYEANEVTGAYSPDADSAGRRALRNRALALSVRAGSDKAEEAARQQFARADNMTDRLAALGMLVNTGTSGWEEALAAFYDDWKNDPLVLDKWFMLQAMNARPGAVARLEALTHHKDFDWKNPNRFRSVVAAFAAGNAAGFHSASGAGYRLVADWLIRLDPVNPQTTARVAGCFETWRRYVPDRQEMMKAEIDRILATPKLSRNTSEILSRIRGA